MAEFELTDLAQAAAELVVSRLDESYQLLYIDRGDRLSDPQIHKLFEGESDVLDEDWEANNRDQGTKHVLETLLDADALEFLDQNEALDTVRHAIEERDASDPIGDLMRETGSKLFRYRLDAESGADPWRMSDDEVTTFARTLGDGAGIDFAANADALRELVAHASYGGGLHVLWRGDVRPLYDAVCQVRHHEPAANLTIKWTDPELLVLDQWNGSGHTVRVRGTVSMPFEADRLHLDTAEGGGISWTDVVGGGYQSEGGEPEIHPSNSEAEVSA